MSNFLPKLWTIIITPLEKSWFFDFFNFSLKNRKLKKSKKQNGLVHGFHIKFKIFPSFYFWQNLLATCVWRYSRKKKGFLDSNIRKLKKSKNRNFSMFLVKNLKFLHVYIFCKKQPAKCVWWYSRYSRK